MPNYANMAPIYKHSLRATEPVTGAEVPGTLDPSKRYNLEFTSEMLKSPTPEQYQEATIQDQPQPQPKMPEWEGYGGQTDIDYLPDDDYELGRVTSKRQFLDDMKLANELMPGSPEYLAFAEEAQMSFRARNAKMNLEREKTENAFRQIRQDPKFTAQEKRAAKVQYYDANPIWEAKKVQYPKAKETSRFDLLKGLIEPPTITEPVEEAPSLWESMKSFWAGEGPAKSLEAPAKPKWLVGYPDAVWNPQLKAWTILEGGNVVTLSEE